jgi:hypothetical protein
LWANEYITVERYTKLLADLVEGQVIVPVDRGNGIGYALK